MTRKNLIKKGCAYNEDITIYIEEYMRVRLISDNSEQKWANSDKYGNLLS